MTPEPEAGFPIHLSLKEALRRGFVVALDARIVCLACFRQSRPGIVAPIQGGSMSCTGGHLMLDASKAGNA